MSTQQKHSSRCTYALWFRSEIPGHCGILFVEVYAFEIKTISRIEIFDLVRPRWRSGSASHLYLESMRRSLVQPGYVAAFFTPSSWSWLGCKLFRRNANYDYISTVLEHPSDLAVRNADAVKCALIYWEASPRSATR